MLKPMLPTLIFDIPKGDEWVYEIKYDGFRVLLHWDETQIALISRNGNSLNEQFPEVIQQCQEYQEQIAPFLPIVFDGELCILESSYKASFERIQQRGRLKNSDKITVAAKENKAHYLIFDLLNLDGQNLYDIPFMERKTKLFSLFEELDLKIGIDHTSDQLLQSITYYTNNEEIWKIVDENQSEGIIAKKQISKWDAGKRTTSWYKVKNWQKGCFIVTGFDKKNGFFHVSVLKQQEMYEIGLFSHGMRPEEREALLQVIQTNSIEETASFIKVSPGICVELFFLELYKEQLRQPSFSQFRFDIGWTDCTFEKLQTQIAIPAEVTITHPDKPLWKNKSITKQDYLDYLMAISPYMLPFLTNRLLTVIRYPHGMYGESFYQKNRPDYTPDFIKTVTSENIEYIVCNDRKTLAWLGNQLAFEFHIPFQTVHSKGPSEIVFDLDPPSREYFHLAVKAALILKEVFAGLKLLSFIKLSGNKGLQIYIPLPENRFTYDETRQFTEFIAHYLITMEPKLFTIERLKKNRDNRLYVDYIQHAEGKTIISPYSVRGNDGAFVAAPLYWEEVTESLSIEPFSMDKILHRVQEVGCPFRDYFKTKEIQKFEPVLDFLQERQNRPFSDV